MTSTAAQRWSDVGPIWLDRSGIAAQWLKGVPSVIDFGCGAEALRGMLDAGVGYTGVDVVARSADTIVCDLNVDPFPNLRAAACAMLGVLEYLDDVPGILRQMTRYPLVVVSYCQHGALQSKQKRLRYWRNHYSARQFRALVHTAGFEIVRRRRFRFAETIYLLAPR